MKFTLKKSDIKSAIDFVAPLAMKKSVMPVMNCILLSGDGSKMTMTSSDGSCQYNAVVDSDAVINMAFDAAKLKKIMDIASNDDEIEFDLKESKLSIKSGKSKFNLLGIDGKEMPVFEDSKLNDNEFEIKSDDLIECINSVKHAMAEKDIRHYLNGIFLHGRNGTLNFVATTGTVLAHAQINNFENEVSAILPDSNINDLLRLCAHGELAKCSIFGASMSVSCGSINMTFSLVDGKYPDYERLIPKNFSHEFSFVKNDFIDAVKNASIAKPKTSYAWVEIKGETMTIKCQDEMGQESIGEVLVSYSGSPFKGGFNVDFLVDCINSMGCDGGDTVFSGIANDRVNVFNMRNVRGASLVVGVRD